jgi:phytoene dehydrogenase-like protein
MLLERYATYNGSDARTCPATLNCIAWVELGLGVYGIEGGLYSLIRALERVAMRLGVEVRTDTPVRRIDAPDRVRGVVLDDAMIHADAVVCNADIAHLADTLLPGPRSPKRPKTASMSGWTAVFRARSAPDRLAHEVLFPSDYEAEFADIFDHDRPPREPTVYVCAQSRAHGRLAWPDAEPLFVMANAPPEPLSGTRDPSVWTDLRQVVHERLLRSGLVHADDPVIWERSPRGLADTYPGTRGSLYGAASNTRLDAFGRPPNRWTRVPGLYLASGSAHPGGGVPLCAQSGRLAAHAALVDLGIATR